MYRVPAYSPDLLDLNGTLIWRTNLMDYFQGLFAVFQLAPRIDISVERKD